MTKKNKWYMTDDEIRRSWRCAKDPIEQVKILAELNCKTKQEIMTKLIELGIDPPQHLSRRGLPPKIDEPMKRKIWKMRQEGKTYQTIADLLEGKPKQQTIINAYKQMVRERAEARGLLVKALQAYTKSDACTDKEREIIMKHIARGI